LCLHQRVLAGEDGHHILEAAAKSLGLALHRATQLAGSGPGADAVSTKGPVRLDVR
jgi:imidazoleglycerol phosphate dehydratase HisB